MRIHDFNTEAYFEAWKNSRERAAETLQREVQRIGEVAFKELDEGVYQGMAMDEDGSIGFPLLPPDQTFEWITRALIEIERTIESYLSRRTTDVWLLQCRRDLACRLFDHPGQQQAMFDSILVWGSQLASAIAQFAAPGNTVLPDQHGMYENVATEDLAVEIHILNELCELHENAQVQRRRLLRGGMAFVSGLPFPEIKLLPHIEARGGVHQRSARHGLSVFARIGLHILPIQKPGFATENPWCLLPTVATVHGPAVTEKSYESVSEVRPFSLVLYDIRQILEALEIFAPAIRRQWGLSPLEIVAAAQVAYSMALGFLAHPEQGESSRYVLETRAVFSTEESILLTLLHEEIPDIAQKLGGRITAEETPSIVARFMDLFASRPGQTAQQDPQNTKIRLHAPVPFLFRAGNKILLDLSIVLRAFSSIVNFLDLEGLQVAEKGRRFEEQVRSYLLSSDLGLQGIPDMERRFFEDGKEIGEADVVVRWEDTAFLIECKSHRYRGINDCITWKQALNRTRALEEWARQAHRTAQYLAAHPEGARHRVPEDVDWIVPILCSPVFETIWQDDDSLYLIKDEIPIAMTPQQILDFIHSRRWESKRDQMVQYPVGHPATLLAAGEELFSAGRLPESYDAYQRALKARPDSYKAWLGLGNLFVEVGQLEEGIEAYHKALALDPGEPVLLRQLGVALYHAGRFDEAISVYRSALEREPQNPDILIFLANALDARGDIGEAITTYRKAVRITPQNPHAHYNLAIALTRKGRLWRAVGAYRKAIKLHPDYFEAHVNLGALLLSRGRLDRSITHLLRAVEIAPHSEPARGLLAQALERTGRRAEALCHRAVIAINQGNLDEALPLAQEATSLEPDLLMAHILLGRLHALRGQPDLAAGAFRKASALSPDSFGARLELALALQESGQLDEALAALRNACTSAPKDAETRRRLGSTFNNLGIGFAESRRDDVSIPTFREALELDPENPIAHYNLGNALLRQEDVEGAILAYQRATELKPDYSEALNNLGSALFRKARFADAAEACRKALEIDPDDAFAIANLAMLYYRQGWLHQALPVYQRFLSRIEEQPERHPNPLGVLERYAELLRTLGRETEAYALEARMLELRGQSTPTP